MRSYAFILLDSQASQLLGVHVQQPSGTDVMEQGSILGDKGDWGEIEDKTTSRGQRVKGQEATYVCVALLKQPLLNTSVQAAKSELA